MMYNDKGPKICIIGAGFSGICAGVQLKRKLKCNSFTVFEKNSELGGTWYANTYLGCTCDVMSYLYCYSFEPNPKWSSSHSPQPEILEYLKNVANKYKLYKKIKFNTEVKSLNWDEKLSKWKVTTFDKLHNITRELLFDVVMNGSGFLREPKIPEEYFPFQGEIFHSAQWDSSVNLKNKRIGIVGSGASAIQIIPKVAEIASEVHCFQRSPAYVVSQPRFKIPNFIKFLFSYIPFLLLIIRWLIFWAHDICQSAFMYNTLANKIAQWVGEHNLKRQVSDPKLRELLMPNYPIGCKRILISSDYYKSMVQPHVKIHRDQILEVNDKGIKTKDNELQHLDVLILCTGFDVHKYFSPISITSKNGQDILSLWTENGPRGFLGITHSALPNFFSLLGPNTFLAHSSTLFMIECQVNYILLLLKEMKRKSANIIELKPEAEDKYSLELEKQSAKTIWLHNPKTNSWYTVNGKLDSVWPWHAFRYWIKSRKVDLSMYILTKIKTHVSDSIHIV